MPTGYLPTSLFFTKLWEKVSKLKLKSVGATLVNNFSANGCAFHLVEIFHFVEIQSLFCLYRQNGLEFFDLILQL